MHRVFFRRLLPRVLPSTAYTLRCASNVPFRLADIGEGIKEVEILRWYVSVGDTLQQFDKVCEVQSDKAAVEITSRYEGVVTSLADSDIVEVGQPLLHLNTSEDVDTSDSESDNDGDTTVSSTEQKVDSKIESVDTEANDPPLDAHAGTSQEKLSPAFQMSPAVRKLIHDNKIDTSKLQGTGPNGRVLKADVLGLLEADNPAALLSNRTEKHQSTAAPLDRDVVVPLRGYSRIMFDR